MEKSRITFLITEILLAILVAFFVRNIFLDERPQKRVAVIVENSGDERWDSFINGMKQAAELQNIHLVICNTDEIENAQEEQGLIYEQLDNNIDAFIIQAAPGYDVLEMLEDVSRKKPVVLVANDALTSEISDDIHAASDIPGIMPDHYEMGYQLGKELLQKNGNDIKGKTVGIVSGLEETDSAKKRQQGLRDALYDSGCQIRWQINTEYDQSIAAMVEQQEHVDLIAVLETESLEQLGELVADGRLQGTMLYGIGNSMKSVYYLDAGVIQSLIVADSYDMGYNSVVEISHALEYSLYAIPNHKVGLKILHREDIFTEEIQQFLYTYE